MFTELTCSICSSTQNVQDALQALCKTEASSDELFTQCLVATEQHFLDAATKWTGKHFFPDSFYE